MPLRAGDFKSPVSTSFTTRARMGPYRIWDLGPIPAVRRHDDDELPPKGGFIKVTPLLAVAALAFASSAHAQPRAGVITVDAVEAVVTVVKVDQAARVVVVRG